MTDFFNQAWFWELFFALARLVVVGGTHWEHQQTSHSNDENGRRSRNLPRAKVVLIRFFAPSKPVKKIAAVGKGFHEDKS